MSAFHSNRHVHPFTAPLAFAAAVALPAVFTQSARADLSAYINASNLESTRTFLATNIAPVPTVADIGTLTGNNTYEFIVNSTGNTSGSLALLATRNGQSFGTEAIKFDQWAFSGSYGATQYGVADRLFNIPTRYNAVVVLHFVADPVAQTTRLFVDGVDTGSTVPFAVSLSGLVGLGGAYNPDSTTFDNFEGSIIAAAAYNSRLSSAAIAAHSNAYYIPGPSSAGILALGGAHLAITGRRRRHTVATRLSREVTDLAAHS